ncbi:hypothetical protein [Bosea sp. (in: a-proteobacteria)]|uniref:hypothetical protein n=1 Tax=Bosea sp. (in: a-proteobacteria) TaxID=1871050 RepID=UPI00260E3182|nr:hypothetical protein [Bosea sp. (in: a-proteobacteria)]MCO5092631.1 DUF1367 family protein [Bosea sp. (in: a-proteobacteria)]
MSNDLRSRVFVKRNGGLFPGDALARAAFAKMKDGAGYLVNLHRPRNLMHHRKLFALLNLVQDNTDRWPTVETLLDDLKISTGLFETRVNAVTGIPYIVAKSISFASMTQDEFEQWFERAVDLICKQVLAMDREYLLAEIGDILAGRRAA